MSKGFCILAENNVTTDYIRQAYFLALSIHRHNKDQKVSLLTNDAVPDSYKHVFDQIIPIPWKDSAKDSEWKINNRWKIYHITPYKETIVMDADMIVLENIEHWWKELEKRDLFFVSNVRTYRNETVTSNYYRKTFTSNNLPNLYSGIHYFKKSNDNKTFFVLLETIVHNYQHFYSCFSPVHKQDFCSIDVSAAIASKLIGNAGYITDPASFITFTHMKPNIQNWNKPKQLWTDAISYDIDNEGNLYVGNFRQSGIFHYVENEFLTDMITKRLQSL